MVRLNSQLRLPTGDELPDTDNLPVDNELQVLVSNLLHLILGFIWADRFDWFFGVNMGIYHPTAIHPRVPIVPDTFLCLGIERVRGDRLRKSYVVWEEGNIVPCFALEIVSQTPGGEYDEKMSRYAAIGISYYVVYNPDYWQRDGREPFEAYCLADGTYQRQRQEPFWMEAVGLGIGREIGVRQGIEREWLYWYNQEGDRYSHPEESAIAERQKRQQLEVLLARYKQQFGELPETP